jgi:DNA-binding GntR family transcriptional regulator
LNGLSFKGMDMILPMSDAGQTASDDAIVERIVAAVMEHKLPPGAKLAENALCDVFNVSRTQIRRILVVLGERGVVTLHPNRGAFVWSPSAEEARDVFAARRVIEKAVVEQAAGVIDHQALTGLREIVAAGAAANARDDRRESIRLSGQFHIQIAEIAGNAVLTRFLEDLVARTSLIIAFYGARTRHVCSDADHGDLIEALAARDAARAGALMEHHLKHIEAALDMREAAEPQTDIRKILAA